MNRERTVSITPRTLALDGMFTALLILLGMIKLPSILPGAEFQLSAPYAVCLVAGGLIVSLLPGKKWAMVLAGPVGTGCARVVLAGVLGVPVLPLLGAAVPGMVFTGVCVALLEPVLRRIPGMEQCAREE